MSAVQPTICEFGEPRSRRLHTSMFLSLGLSDAAADNIATTAKAATRRHVPSQLHPFSGIRLVRRSIGVGPRSNKATSPEVDAVSLRLHLRVEKWPRELACKRDPRFRGDRRPNQSGLRVHTGFHDFLEAEVGMLVVEMIDRDRGEPRSSAPPTPPCVRVRTRRFEKLR